MQNVLKIYIIVNITFKCSSATFRLLQNEGNTIRKKLYCEAIILSTAYS